MLVTSLILQHLDYCNGVLVGLPASSIRQLQRVQNAAARLVLSLDHRTHITPALQQLHWLPLVATLVHHTYSNTASTYLSDFVSFSPTRSLRSTANGAAAVQRTLRNWVTVPSPSLAREFGTICQRHYTTNCFRCCFQKTVEDLSV